MTLWNWPSLRAIAYLKRIAVAQERIAAAEEEWLSHERAKWIRESVKRPRPTEFGTFNIEAANEDWRKREEAAEVGQIPEDAV